MDGQSPHALACDVRALRKCLEENNGDRAKCKREIEAFKASCSSKMPDRPQYTLSPRPVTSSSNNIVTEL